MQQLIDKGHEVILWTTRNGEELVDAVDWCGKYGLHFTNVNGPATSNREEYRDRYPTESRKIYADVYIDDHNLEYVAETHDAKMWLIKYLRTGVRIWKTEEK